MKKLPILVFFCICSALNTTSQSRNSIEGKVIDLESGIPLTGVSIEILHLDIFTKSNTDGLFKIRTIPLGDQILHVSFIGYASQRIQISSAKNIQLNLGTIYLAKTQERLPDISIISLSESDLLDDDNLNSDNISGLFQSSKDAFLRAAAFNFGQVWFKVRGYDSSYGVISINGIEMNKLFDGRPQWTNSFIVN